MKRSKIDVINILKYGMLLVIIVYVVLLLASQGGDAPVKTVKKRVLAVMNTGGMKEAANRDFKRCYGLNANDYGEVVLYLPGDVMDVDELLIVRVKNGSQTEDVREAAKKRLDTQIESFEGYGARQTKLLKSAILEERGSYVFMAVGEDADKAYAAFKKSL